MGQPHIVVIDDSEVIRVLFSELLEIAEAKHEVRSDKHAEVRT